MRSILQWFGLSAVKSTLKKLEVKREKTPGKAKRTWSYEGRTTQAHTKSEARANFKILLDLKRLPVGAVVELVEELEEAAA